MKSAMITAALVAAALLAVPGSAHAQEPPAAACSPGSPSALRVAGLPARIPFGREEVFSLDYDDYDWDVVGPIEIAMKTGDHTFSHETTTDELADLFVELDLGDRPASITASFEQSDEAAGGGSRCVQTISARTRGYRHFGAINRCDAPSYRPRSIVLACGDGNFGLTRLRWRGWNRAVAGARGSAYANDCNPYCAAGHFYRYPVNVRASRPRRMGGVGYAYTRLRITFPGARPAGIQRVQVRKGVELDGSFFWR